ncbi:NAD(P)-dependent oxidoreductase [Paenibacillus beijingensis]|uniref:6-phosphogluconate dehydrogenase n=1 Tax=Paenibacillus beijingensis TaxID=1126833 RepID=A0A0D5NM32_9BACL|nr:NAD(P)-dependent oxidoreductase [Paenibacillus beijingensis]AJY76316.1 6-phosphogluconate dehydrogenase [Paenibacillus beijingensis]
MKAAVVGLGNMGLPMASNLLKAGFEVKVYNRTASRAEPLLKQGARLAETPADAARGSDIVLTMVADDAAAEQTALGEGGVLEGLKPGGIHISSSTISPDCSRKLMEAHAKAGQHYIAAPVLGRPDAAEAGALKMLVAGPEDARAQAMPFFEAVGKEIFVIGDKGPLANVMKLANNFLLASMLEALSEAQVMTGKYGIAPETFMDVANSLFQSPVYRNYGGLMTGRSFDPAGFKLKLGLKDVELALSAAEAVTAPLPLGKLVRGHFREGIARGWGELDWAALIQCVEVAEEKEK